MEGAVIPLTDTEIDRLAAAIYWAGWTSRGADHVHPFTRGTAWSRAGSVQREFCRQQAHAALGELDAMMGGGA